jgi:hypothetical protein
VKFLQVELDLKVFRLLACAAISAELPEHLEQMPGVARTDTELLG